MKRTEITCAACGKKVAITAGEGHISVVKCECGAETQVQGDPGPVLDLINTMLPQIVGVIKEVKGSGGKGPQSGLAEGVHTATRDMVVEVLKEDKELREALKAYVRASLEASLFQQEKGAEEPPEPPPRG